MVLNFVRRIAQRSSFTSRNTFHTTPATLSEARVPTRQNLPSVATLFSGRLSASRLQTQHQLPQYHSNDVTGILAGVAVVGAVIGVGKMWWDAASSPSYSNRGRTPTVDGVIQVISRDEVLGFFEQLLASIQELFVRRAVTPLCIFMVLMLFPIESNPSDG